MKGVTKSVLQFSIGFIMVLIVSALLAPWLYTFLPFKFDRILRRLIMIGTLVLVWGLFKQRRESLGRIGLGWREDSRRLLSSGFLSGLGIILLISAVQWVLGARVWQLDPNDLWHWIGLLLKAFGAGALIGLIEEFFFRGFLFITLKDLWDTKWSLVMTNLIYAFVHFFPGKKPFVDSTPTVFDSFRILGSFTSNFSGNPDLMVPLLGLFIFGLILSFCFLLSKSLYLPMGVHAGCVFGLKMTRRFIPDISEKMNLVTGGQKLYDGVLGLTVLALIALWLSGNLIRRPGPEKSL